MSLLDLLNEGAAFDCEYAGGLSNHRPMALLALAGLGADVQRLAQFAHTYSTRLQPAPPPTRWPAGDPWASRLGERGAWPAYRDLFLHWLYSEDARDVLRQSLPVLMQGCGAAAFHGLIRTAYAVQAAHRQELADALAYWACRWLDLGMAADGLGTVDDPAAVLTRLHAVPPKDVFIFQRMQSAAAQPRFAAAVDSLRIDDARTLPGLAALGAQAYAATGNFTALHLVTSAHALRLLMPYLDEPQPSLQAYWRAYAAAVCAAALQPGTPPRPRPWGELLAAACASDDDHLIKLVYSCREEQAAHDGRGPWQAAATRAVHKA